MVIHIGVYWSWRLHKKQILYEHSFLPTLRHLILLCAVVGAVPGSVIVAIDEIFDSSLHIDNIRGGNVSVFLNAKIGADDTGLGIFLDAKLVIDGLFDVVVDIVIHRLVDTLKFGVDPSDFLPLLLDLVNLFG